MAITVECKQCRTKAEVPRSTAGAQGKCRTCGAVMHVPGEGRKVCNGCGVDVAHAKRWKDEAGQYYCDACWRARGPSLNDLDALCAADTSDVTLRRCDICGVEYPETYLTKLGPKSLCVSCHIAERKKVEQKKANWAEARKDLARQAGNKAKNAIKFATLAVVGAVAVAVTIVAITTHNDHSDWQVPTAREQQPSGEESHQVDQQQKAEDQQRQAAALDLAQMQEKQRQVDAEAKAQEAQNEEEARKLAERERVLGPARIALLNYGMARVYFDGATRYRESAEEYAKAVAESEGASGNVDWSKVHKAGDEAIKALDQEDRANKECIRCLEKLKTFNGLTLSGAAQDLIHDSSVDIHVREAVVDWAR